MEILGKKGLSGIVKVLLDLVFIGGIIIFISLPFSLDWCFEHIMLIDRGYYIFFLAFLYVTGFFALVIVNEIRKIFNSLNNNNPFTMNTVKNLNRMAFSAFIISAVYVVKMFVINSFFTIIVSMMFVMGGFFSLILGEVFRQAVIAKEENDLTI